MRGGRGAITNKLTAAQKIFLLDLSFPRLTRVDKGGNIVPICGDIQNLCLKVNADIIICTEVLEHLQNPQKALNTFNKLLKDNGKMFITVPVSNLPCKKLVAFLYRRFYKINVHKDEHLRIYSTKTIMKEINEAGFAIDAVVHRSVFHYAFVKKGILNWLLAGGVSLICSKRKSR